MASKLSRSTSVQDDYVLLEQIGQHAGKVFRAQHVREQRSVVVRIWRAPDIELRDRFVAAAQLAASVRHPVLPAIEAFGSHGDSTCYIVSECARGESLNQWADRVGIPPVATAIELFQRVCVGLNAAHRNGLVHEALNPRNLFVTQGESDPLIALEPCLLDLGVPAFVRTLPPPLRSAQFMAPEQLARALARGERVPPPADMRMNVYSCGALLHYLCTGGAPFAGRTLDEFARAQAAGNLLPPSRINPLIPPALDGAIMRALAHDPNERYANMSEFGQALERVRTGTGASGVRPRVMPATPAAFEYGPFDERPTSEAPRIAILTPLRPPASEQSAAPIHFPQSKPTSDSGPIDDLQRRTPAGLFSSAPPAVAAAEALPQIVEEVEPEFAELANAHPHAKRWGIAAAAALAVIALAWGLSRPSATPAGGKIRVADDAQPAVAVEAAPASPIARSTPVPAPAFNDEPSTSVVRVEGQGVAGAAFETPAQQRAAKLRMRKPARDNEPVVAVVRTRVEPHAEAAREVVEPRAREAAVSPEPPVQVPAAPEPSTRDQAAPAAAVPAAPRVAPAQPAAEVWPPASKAQPLTPLKAKARSSDLVVHGSVATSVVRRAVERMRPQFEACYERAALSAGRNGFGTANVEVEIDEHGRARNPHAHGSSLPGLDACLAQSAQQLVADRPPDTGRVQASFKVAFTP